MGRLGEHLHAYAIWRRNAKAADLLWKYYGLPMTDEIRLRLVHLSEEVGGEVPSHTLAMLYLSEMLEEYEGDPHAPVIHASVEFLLRRATAADAESRQFDPSRLQRLKEIAMRKYGWEQ